MILIRTGVLAVAVGSTLLPSLLAQESSRLDEKMAPVARQLAEWQRLLAARKSLSLVTAEFGHVERGFGHDDDPDFTATIKTFYKGDRFLYDYEFVGPKGITIAHVENFDGARYGFLRRKGGGIFETSSGRFVDDVVMCKRHFFFNAFLFLESGFHKNELAQLSYDRLTDKKDWTQPFATLLPASTAEEVAVDHETFLKVSSIGLHPDPVSTRECVYDVYFSQKLHGYPMKWERRLAAGGELVASWSVEKLGSLATGDGSEIPYPRVSSVKNYQGGKLRDSERCEVTEIHFDSVNDEDLSIDSGAAQIVRDLDVPLK